MKIKAFRIREHIFKQLFVLYDQLKKLKTVLYSFSLFIFTLTSIIFLCLFVFDLGFNFHPDITTRSFSYLLISLFICKVLLELTSFQLEKWKFLIGKSIILLCVFIIILAKYDYLSSDIFLFGKFLHIDRHIIVWSFILIITEIYHLSDAFYRLNLSPTFLFAGSFIVIILIGSGLLMMPKATNQPLTYFDALFTSVSAVCVTGLVVVDTASYFTPIGKSIILTLIQIGGLGIMVFTGFFSFIFTGAASIRERLLLKDVFSNENLSGLFKLLLKIILFTIIIEMLGTVMIYHALEGSWNDKMVLSVFHSISAFCNAGFSIFPEGLANQSIHFNSYLQLTICLLIILGGMGFPVLLFYYGQIKRYFFRIFDKLLNIKSKNSYVRLAIGPKIAIRTTSYLLIIGTLLYFFFEKNNTLSGQGSFQQIVTSFFGSTSARTAGFNIMDISRWGNLTIYMMIFLMWIGASPGSTGGGIKTTTFALAFITAVNYCRGRKYVEIENREIGIYTIQKVLTVMFVSIMVIVTSFGLLMLFEPDKKPDSLLFECVSAFSTVGLSVVNTPTLCEKSKTILIMLMYIGRIGPVLLLTQIFSSNRNNYHRLPVENLAIN